MYDFFTVIFEYITFLCFIFSQLQESPGPIDVQLTGKISPSLIVTVDENTVTSSHIVGYGRSLVEVHGKNLVQRGILLLMATYYILDFAYPPCYSLTLKFIQHYIFRRGVKDLPKTVKTLCTKANIDDLVD